MFKKKSVVFLLILFLVIGFFLYSSKSRLSNTTVYLTETGFTPKVLYLKKGGTVRFESKLNKLFWPASDLHPSHLVYPEFDSKGPVEPGVSWTFVFEKNGKWDYHDHLNPNWRGNIIVGDIFGQQIFTFINDPVSRILVKLLGKEKYIKNTLETCPKGEAFEKSRLCWEGAISKIDKHFGIDATFEFLEKAIKNDTNLAGTCHYYAEYIGFLAYERLYNGEDPKVYEKAEMCGNGFYHAFLQEWVSHTKDLDSANNYCNSLSGGKHKYAKDNCTLGIGLGLT